MFSFVVKRLLTTLHLSILVISINITFVRTWLPPKVTEILREHSLSSIAGARYNNNNESTQDTLDNDARRER